MKIVTLMENTPREGFTAEHGLSLYIEARGRRILFDAGKTGAFADNAAKLGIDLGKVDFAVLSHGHDDHGGGLPRFREINPAAKIYVNQFAAEPHFNARGKDIGVGAILETLPGLVFTQGNETLAEGIALKTLPMPPEDTDGMTALRGGCRRAEDFAHEQYLRVEEGGKTYLFSGCSHKGVRRIADFFQPDVLVGGFHFRKIQEEAFLETAARELLSGKTVYYTGHCTGEAQYEQMKKIMGGRLRALTIGEAVEL